MTAAALLALALAFSPLEAEERNVREGNERLLAGDAEAALRRYEAAERAVGPRAALDYDRGIALHRLGRLDAARDAYRRALDRGAGGLSSRTLQNLGSTLDALGDRDGAIAAFREALRRDPANEDARYDLEVLLRRKDGGKGSPEEGAGGGKKDAPSRAQGAGPPEPEGEKAPQREPPPEQQGADAQAKGGPRPPAREPGAGPRATGAKPEDGARAERDAPAGPQAAPLTRQDAEQLLDALRAREKNMPLAGREKGDGRRADVAKDW